MNEQANGLSRRGLLGGAGRMAAAAALGGAIRPSTTAAAEEKSAKPRGSQRLSLDALRAWEAMRYGMFIHFGMSTYLGTDRPSRQEPMSTYAPDRLDVDQWVSVARDAGMKYAVLTAKHAAGHCLWPSRHTTYTVANSGNRTDVVDQFVRACEKRGVRPGLYYCSWDNGHRFGSRTPSDPRAGTFVNPLDFSKMRDGEPDHPDKPGYLCSYTTSLYHDFMTAQLTELLTQYGPIAEVWIDIPGVLGRGYRTFLYQHITGLQPDTVVVTNSGLNNGEPYRVAYAWPADVIGIEVRRPPESGHNPWRTIEGKEYYLPCELCDSVCKNWFFMPDDPPKPDAELRELMRICRERHTSLLLNVPPDGHGRMRDEYVQALHRLATAV